MKTTTQLMLVLAVLLALALSAHGFGQIVSIPVIGETTGKAIEGNLGMVVAGTSESGKTFEYDTIPTIPHPMGVRVDVVLYNLAVRPEADSTLGVAIGVGGVLDYGEWRGRSAADKHYDEKSRGELRRAHLGSVDQPGRWITAIRTGSVGYVKQRKGQNGPLTFTAYLEPEDLHPGLNVFIVRVHGILEQRTTRFLVLGKDGKSIFGTYDEPWLVKVGEDKTDGFSTSAIGPVAGDYVTPQELVFALNNLKEEIRAMLRPTPTHPTATTTEQDGGLHVIWNEEDIGQAPTTPRVDPTPQMPDASGIKFNFPEGAAVSRQGQVKVVFDPDLPVGSWVEVATFSQGQWWPWQKVSGATTGLAINLAKLKSGPIALTVVIRATDGKTMGFAQVNLTLEGN